MRGASGRPTIRAVTDIGERTRGPELPGGADSGIESTLSELWCEFLECDTVDPGDDFFSLGGDSLLAIRMLAAVDDRLGVPIGFPEFADTPTIAFLVEAIQAERPVREVAAAAPTPATTPSVVPATPAQERLWFLEEMTGARGVYNMPLGARLRGAVDADALERSLNEIVRRHGALRTGFEDEGGTPVQ